MNRRRFVAPLAVTAAVAAGGIAGATLGVPSTSGAQEATEDAPSSDEGSRLRGRGFTLEAAAEALGIDAGDLMARLRDGETIAEVAAAQGVDVDTVIDAMVAHIVENTDLDEAEVRERVTTMVNEGFRGGPGLHGRHRRFPGPGLDAAAAALGMETSDLADALRDGQTIAEVAAEKGVDVDTVIDAMVEEARERISTFVNEGPQRPDRDDTAESDDAEDSGDAEDAAA